jgi:hypothetical protein
MGENKVEIKFVLTTSEATRIAARKRLKEKRRIAVVRNLSRGSLRMFRSIKKQANMQPAIAAMEPAVTVNDKLKNQYAHARITARNNVGRERCCMLSFGTVIF